MRAETIVRELGLNYDELPEKVKSEIYVTERELGREYPPEIDSITERTIPIMKKKTSQCKKVLELFNYPLIIATNTGLAYFGNKIGDEETHMLAGCAVSYYEGEMSESDFRRISGESPENLWIKRFDYNKETLYAIAYKENYHPLLNHVIMILLMILDSPPFSSQEFEIQFDFILKDRIEDILNDAGILQH